MIKQDRLIDLKEKYRQIFIDALNGSSYKELHERYQYHIRTIRSILRDNYSITPEDIRDIRNSKIISLYLESYDIDKVRSRYNLSADYIKQILWASKVKTIKRYNGIIKDKVLHDSKLNQTFTSIGKKHGISRKTVSKMIETRVHFCKNCGDQFTPKGRQEYCTICKMQYKYNNLMPGRREQRQCEECGRLFKIVPGSRVIYCSRYCYKIARLRESRPNYIKAIQLKSLGERPAEIYKKLNISRTLYYGFMKSRHNYLDIPPLYWSSDELVLKHNTWETSRARTELLLRAKQERKAFEKWGQRGSS